MALFEEGRRPEKSSLPAHLSKSGPLPRSFLRYERHGVEKRYSRHADGAAVAQIYFLYLSPSTNAVLVDAALSVLRFVLATGVHCLGFFRSG